MQFGDCENLGYLGKPQHSLWLPLSWLREDNTLVFLEEVRMRPDRLIVSVSSFGPQATLEI